MIELPFKLDKEAGFINIVKTSKYFLSITMYDESRTYYIDEVVTTDLKPVDVSELNICDRIELLSLIQDIKLSRFKK